MHHPAKRSLAIVCEHTRGVLPDIVMIFHCDICPEHSLVVRRNHLKTEAANSLSAAAGPKLSIIAILASD